MKNATLKIKPIIVFMMAMLGLTVAANAVAHDQIGSLGEDASATDYYMVTCSTDAGGESDRLEVRLLDATITPGGGKISAVIQRENVAATASDPVRVTRGEGCAGFNDVKQDKNPGPLSSVALGNGVYYIMVHKQKPGPKNYLLQYHCKSAEGIHTGTAIVTIQDQ